MIIIWAPLLNEALHLLIWQYQLKALLAKKGKGETFVTQEKEPESTSQYRDPGIQKMVKKLAPQPALQQETKMIKNYYLPPKVTHYIYSTQVF